MIAPKKLTARRQYHAQASHRVQMLAARRIERDLQQVIRLTERPAEDRS